MTTVEVLRAARALIDTPDKWCQGERGRDGSRLCAGHAVGDAIGIGYGRATWAEGHPALVALARAMGTKTHHSVPFWNDNHTHAEVMAAFDRAIANEEAREGEFTARPVSTIPDTPIFA